MSDAETKKRRPVKRWIVLALIIAGIYSAFIGPGVLKPIPPVVVLPGEPTGLAIGSFQITNTVLATLLADILLLLMGFRWVYWHTFTSPFFESLAIYLCISVMFL